MLPNFFIVGAPKCGTSALATYLAEHPDAFVSRPKEPNFFSTDFPNMQVVKTESDYLDLFRSASQAAVGEASTWYLYSEVALENIRSRYPDARIIVMVRNPIDLVYSLYSQFRWNMTETEPTFERAWQRRMNEPGRMKRYGDVGKLGAQLSRALTVFGSEAIHTIVYDDLAQEPGRVYGATLQFLGLENDGRSDFRRVNANKTHRSVALQKFLKHTPQPIVSINHGVKRILRIERWNILGRLEAHNRKRVKRQQLEPSFKAQLAEFFKEDVTLLGQLLDRDLSNWLETK